MDDSEHDEDGHDDGAERHEHGVDGAPADRSDDDVVGAAGDEGRRARSVEGRGLEQWRR